MPQINAHSDSVLESQQLEKNNVLSFETRRYRTPFCLQTITNQFRIAVREEIGKVALKPGLENLLFSDNILRRAFLNYLDFSLDKLLDDLAALPDLFNFPTGEDNRELQWVKFFNDIAGKIESLTGVKSRRLWIAANILMDVPLADFRASRKPDLALIPLEPCVWEGGKFIGTSEYIDWFNFDSSAEEKKNPGARKSKEKDSLDFQITDRAYFMFTGQRHRRFILNLCMAGTFIRLTQYNRARVVHGEYFDAQAKENRSTLLRIVVGLMFCAPEDIGYEAEDINDESKWVTIKDVWADKSQPYEDFYLNEARDMGIENGIPELVSAESVLFEGAEDTTDRHSFSDKRPEAGPTSSGKPQRRKKEMQEDESWKIRVHRRYVFKGCGIPITQFKNKEELLRVLIDLIRTHKRLVDADLLHRDISLNNVMLWKVLNEERRTGFLIDFDYMVRISELRSKSPSDFRPVGTTPFMSTNVLIGHRLHSPLDDLESFFYVLIFICLGYSGPGRSRGWDI
ncbi:hypothetical protein AX17_005167 [Amanita inopinata Kibby_2008]|nr:hypothetical protein AX17_005167 [Amanita inopinata Kibby_2008]